MNELFISVDLNTNLPSMKKQVFKTLAKINKLILPSFTKKGLDISKASKFQLASVGWRAFVTKNSLN